MISSNKLPDSLDLVTLGADIRKPSQLTRVKLPEMMDRIKLGTYKAAILPIRDNPSTPEAKAKKLNLPYLTPALFDGPRCEANVIQANGIILDFDKVKPNVPTFKQYVKRILEARYIFQSPNDGVKAYIPFSEPVTDKKLYQEIWDFWVYCCEQELGVKPDATPDMCRACFVSYDTELIENLEAKPFDIQSFVSNQKIEALGEAEEKAVALSITETPDKVVSLAEATTPVEFGLASEPTMPLAEATQPTPVGSEAITDPDTHRIKLAVEHLATCKLDYRDWTHIAFALFTHMGQSGKLLWNKLLTNPHYPAETQKSLDEIWAVAYKYSTVGIGSLFFIAKKYGWQDTITPPSDDSATIWDFPELEELFSPQKDIPLDVSRLPKMLCDYLAIVDNITDSSAGFKITALLPVIASNIGNRLMMTNAGNKHYCSIWALLIGPSTISRKNTTINQAQKTMAPFRESMAALTPKENNEQNIELEHVTKARLEDLLSLNSNRLIVEREFGTWLCEMNKPYNQGAIQEITDMFDGSDKKIAKMDVDKYISKPAFSIIGGSTPDWYISEVQRSAKEQGGFCQRLLVCQYRNIDIDKLTFTLRDSSAWDPQLYAWNLMLDTLRQLPGTHTLQLDAESIAFRNEEYTKVMKANALTGVDPLIAYCGRIYENYFFRFTMALWAMKNWKDIKAAYETMALATFFDKRKVDIETTREAMYLCDYYYANAKPTLAELNENGKLELERKIVFLMRGFWNAGKYEVQHSSLMNKAKLNGFEFKRCIDSLIERRAIYCRVSGNPSHQTRYYKLNPVLV